MYTFEPLTATDVALWEPENPSVQFYFEDFEAPNIPENQMVTFVNLACVQRN